MQSLPAEFLIFVCVILSPCHGNVDQVEYVSKAFEPRLSWTHLYVASVILALLIFAIIIGNVFVVAAILLEKNLRIVSNYLILSLAVADLLVATLVMPVSALQEISKFWWLGMILCDIWVCSDVLLCSVSIFHLVAIAIDRYFAISRPTYLQKRTANQVLLMIGACWLSAAGISIPARFHTNRSSTYNIVYNQGVCSVNEDVWYTIFSNLGAFYIPIGFMLFIYAKIWILARQRIRKKKFQQAEKRKISIFNQRSVEEGQLFLSDGYNQRNLPLDENPSSKSSAKRKFTKFFCSTCICEGKCRVNRSNNGSTNGNLTGVTVGAVAAGMRMASAIMTTTKSSRARPSIDPNYLFYVNPYISESSSLDSMASFDREGQLPLSYSIIMSHINRNHEPALYDENGGPLKNDPSILFADDQISNIYSITPSSSEMIYQEKQKFMKDDKISKSPRNSNFLSLTAYERRKKQMKWFKRQKILEKAATKAMDMIVFDCPSIDSITGAQLTPRERLEQKRERKASTTLAIITGCFLLCWLPFSLNTFIKVVFIKSTDDRSNLDALFLWLGYANSLLNPVIYTIFAPDFRNAFRKILFGRYRKR